MPNVSKVNQELVRAFNINLCYNNIAITNLTVQNLHGKDHVVISFDKNTKQGQRMKYLSDLKEKIVKASYKTEKVAGMPYNLQSFPFTFHKERLDKDDKGRKRFSVVIDEGVVFNLKCYLAKALARDIKEKMGSEFGVKYARERVYDVDFDRNSYLYSMYFDDQRLQKYFIDSFSADIGDYENAPRGYLEVRGNYVHIKKSIFDDVEFIKDIAAYNAFLICRDFHTPSAEDKVVENLKFMVIDFIRRMNIPVHSILRTSYKGNHEDSVLIPVVYQAPIVDQDEVRFLNNNDVNRINTEFGMVLLSDVGGNISVRLPKSDSFDGMIYAIDFADVDIACCVLNKIMESSVINAKHELSIDPELRLQALSPSSPTPPPTPVPNGPRPDLTGTSIQGLPTGSHGEELGRSPRQGFMEVSDGLRLFRQPSPQLNSIAVSCVVQGPSSQSLSAAQNVPAGTSASSQQMNRWSLQSTSENKWQPSPEPGPSGLSWNKSGSASTSAWSSSAPSAGFSSWKGPDESGSASTNLWTQQPNPCSPQSTSGNQWQWPPKPGTSGLSCKGAAQNVQVGPSAWSSSAPSAGLWSLQQSRPSSSRGAQAGANISEEEKKLIEALLYTLNLTNYTYGGVYTNFFVKDGEIVSCLHDNVDREKYFQAVRNYIIKEYYGDEKEASKVCDLDEFPFKLNCEEKQEKTVVANISSGALSNLKILFSQKFGKDVDAIDTSAVKKVEKREKDEWVDRQLLNEASLEEACENCFPDEGAMKKIPIAFEEGEYVLDRSRDISEVELLFREQLRRFRDTSVAGKGESDLTEEEKELFKALLYAFNLNNHIFECYKTNFIVKNGKIASLIDDSVNVKEYLQDVRDKTIEEYRVNEKKGYDLNEFPFKFLSNCEKNQKMTVVANISRGALSNLEKLFIYGYKKGDINIEIVEKVVLSKRKGLVNSDVKKIEEQAGHNVTPKELVTGCYPDEGALEYIPIKKCETGYWLDRTNSTREVKSFIKQSHAKGTRNATTTFEKNKKDDSSGYSSGSVTDAENVSSKAEATTSSGYESMDCENTRGGSPKRSLELDKKMEELAISTDLDATKVEQHSPIKKFRSN